MSRQRRSRPIVHHRDDTREKEGPNKLKTELPFHTQPYLWDRGCRRLLYCTITKTYLLNAVRFSLRRELPYGLAGGIRRISSEVSASWLG